MADPAVAAAVDGAGYANYPRDQRYASANHQPHRPRQQLLDLHSRELTGLTGCRRGPLRGRAVRHGQRLGRAQNGLGSPLEDRSAKADAGIDIKWDAERQQRPRPHIQSRFSQVESDVGQIAVNSQFAIFFPEKRPSSSKGWTSSTTPIQAVYTRTITDPKWGLRTPAAGQHHLYRPGHAGPGRRQRRRSGPPGNDFAPQDFSSKVLVGSLRRDSALPLPGLLVTDRENDGGGHNESPAPTFCGARADRPGGPGSSW